MSFPAQGSTKPILILFDVYETLLDMAEIEKRVNSLMESRRAYTIWFQLLMQYCFVDNCTTQFNDFLSIAKATLQMAGASLGTSISDDEIHDTLELLRHLPLHEKVEEGLSLLNDKGFRLAALTNVPYSTVLQPRMERTGLISYFEKVLSAEQIRKYKPCIEVYHWAANKLEVELYKILLVSAHPWDIAGGANAGMQTAYIKHGKQLLYPLVPKPAFTCTNVADLAKQI